MDKPTVFAEVARALRPDALFAFTDLIARSDLRSEDAEVLAREWGFPWLPRLPQYVALLDEYGFEVLLAEDRTRAVVAQQSEVRPRDQRQWEADFAAQHGDAQRQRQRAMVEAWLTLLRTERVGYGMFVSRRRGPSTAYEGMGPGLD
jgi:hypothetical protein